MAVCRLTAARLTEGCRNANDQAFALEFFGQIDLVARRILHETIEVWDWVADLHSDGSSRVEGGTWARPGGSSRSWHNTGQRSCFEHGVNGVRYSVEVLFRGFSDSRHKSGMLSVDRILMGDVRRMKARCDPKGCRSFARCSR